MLPKGGGVVGVLGTVLGSRGRRLAHTQSSPSLAEAGRDREPWWRRAGWARAHWFIPTAMHLASPPPPAAPPRSPIPRPPSIRPPHRKLFLINENGKLGPHITSRDVLGSGSNESRRLGQHSPGFEWPGSGRGLRLPAQSSLACRGNHGPWSPRRAARRSAAPAPVPAGAGGGQLVLTSCAT